MSTCAATTPNNNLFKYTTNHQYDVDDDDVSTSSASSPAADDDFLNLQMVHENTTASTYPNNYRQHIALFFMVKSEKERSHKQSLAAAPSAVQTSAMDLSCSCQSNELLMDVDNGNKRNQPIEIASTTITMLDKFTGLLLPIHQIASKKYLELSSSPAAKRKSNATRSQLAQLIIGTTNTSQRTLRSSTQKVVLPSLLEPLHMATIRETMPPSTFNDLMQSHLNNLDKTPSLKLWLEVAKDNGFYLDTSCENGRVIMPDWFPQWPDITAEQAFLVRCWPFDYYPEFLTSSRNSEKIACIQYYDANAGNPTVNYSAAPRVVESTRQLCSECVYQNRVVARYADVEINRVRFGSEAEKDAAILDGIDMRYRLTVMPMCWFERLNLLIDDCFWCKYCKHVPLFVPTFV